MTGANWELFVAIGLGGLGLGIGLVVGAFVARYLRRYLKDMGNGNK
jgi:hypothetical protein